MESILFFLWSACLFYSSTSTGKMMMLVGMLVDALTVYIWDFFQPISNIFSLAHCKHHELLVNLIVTSNSDSQVTGPARLLLHFTHSPVRDRILRLWLVSMHSPGCRSTWHRSADLGSWKETNDPRVQVRKLQDKVSKCQDNVKKSKEQYELAVSDINNYNSRYQEVTTQLLNISSPHWQTFLLLRTWRMCSNVASGKRLRDSRPLKTLYSKYTNVLTSARTKRKLAEPITASRWWELPLLQVTADIRWVLPHGQQRGSREGPPVVVQHSRGQHAHGLAYLRGMSRSQLLWTVSSMS